MRGDRVWVTRCLCDYIGVTTVVTQIAADLAATHKSAESGHKLTAGTQINCRDDAS